MKTSRKWRNFAGSRFSLTKKLQRAEPRVAQEDGVVGLGVRASKDWRGTGVPEAHCFLDGGGGPGDALAVRGAARGLVRVRGGGGAGTEGAGGGRGAEAELGVVDV